MKCQRCNGTGTVKFGTKAGNHKCFGCNGTGVMPDEYIQLIKMGFISDGFTKWVDSFKKHFTHNGIEYVFHLSNFFKAVKDDGFGKKHDKNTFHCRVEELYYENSRFFKSCGENIELNRKNIIEMMKKAKQYAEERK